MTCYIVRFLAFLSAYFIPIIGAMVLVMAVTGLVLIVAGGLTGVKFDVDKIGPLIGYLTAAGTLGLAKPLKEFADFYVASTHNSDDKKSPTIEAYPISYQAELKKEGSESNGQAGNC